MSGKNNKVVIVGAGMAGLTAAAYLCKENFDVLIIEKNNRSGGLVSTFERDGFSFDTGPRAFVNSGMVQPIMKDLGIDWELLPNKISMTVEGHGFTIDSMESMEDYKNLLLDLYPDETENIGAIMKSIRKLSDYTRILYEFDNPYFMDYMSDKKFVLTKLLPWTFKLLYALSKFKKYNMPMEEYLNERTKNQSLIDILTQFFFRNTPTYFALGYFHVWLDYFYPKGGTGVLPQLLHTEILKDGGDFRFNTCIQEVIPAESRIVDRDGNSYEYDHLVWAADLKSLYRQLNPDGLDINIRGKINSQAGKIEASKPAESSFIMNVATDLPPEYFREKSGAHAFYTHTKQGLGDTIRNIKNDLLDNFDNWSKEDILGWLDDFCSLNTYEISVPVLRDPSLAPDGKTGIMISCLFDFDIIEKIDNAGWAADFKKEFENRIVGLLSKSFFPDFEKNILYKFSTTPMTINKTVGSSGGAIVGWSFETESPVFNELKDMPKSALTPIPDVYQAGQWAYAPAGVPIAMLTGWHSSQEIIKRTKSK